MNVHVGRTATSPHTASRNLVTKMICVFQVAAIAGEILLIANALAGNGLTSLIVGHLAITAILGLIAVGLELAKADTSPLQIFILMSFASGPIGGMAALISEQQMWTPKADALDKWYNTIAPVETPAVTLVDMIIDGRLVRQQSRLPRPYDALLNSGTMHEKQALLAYLAIEDDEKFVEVALALALRSPDQRVRVQAAAVAAHTRGRTRLLKASAANLLVATSPEAAVA